VKIALLHPRAGAAGIWTPTIEAAAMVGVAELNAAGGIRGEEISLVFADSGMNVRDALAAADSLVDIEGVDAVIGAHTSDLRDPVSDRIGSRVPFIYTSQYEGIALRPDTLALSTTDPEILWPALQWLSSERRAQRFFFVGNSYLWPRMAYSSLRSLVRRQGGEICGSAFLPMIEAEHHDLLRRIAASGANVVVQALVGQCAIDFNRQFAAAGLDQKMLRFALIVDEIVVCGIGADATTNLMSASSYFAKARTRRNDRFLELYHDAFGEFAPPVSAAGVGVYEGLHALAALAREYESNTPATLARLMRGPDSRRAARHALANKPIGEVPAIYLAEADGVTLEVTQEINSYR